MEAEAVLAANPDDPAALTLAAICHRELGHNMKARGLLYRAEPDATSMEKSALPSEILERRLPHRITWISSGLHPRSGACRSTSSWAWSFRESHFESEATRSLRSHGADAAHARHPPEKWPSRWGSRVSTRPGPTSPTSTSSSVASTWPSCCGRFDDSAERALAGYNGGPTRSSRFWNRLPQKDTDLFVESISIKETRLYVKKVLQAQARSTGASTVRSDIIPCPERLMAPAEYSPMSLLQADKVSAFTESVIREMTRLAEHHDAINLAQASPDFPCPLALKQAAKEAIDDDYNQQGVTSGNASFREAIARRWQQTRGTTIDPEREVVVTCGATEAMSAAVMGLVNPGEEIIIFEPFYENYGPNAILAGARPRFVRLHDPDFRIDTAELRRAFNYNTKAIILNTPNNPTGKVFTPQELQLIAELCLEWDVIALCDEIYEHLVYGDRKHVPITSTPGMSELTISINSLSKTYGVTGWRVGWAIGPAELIDAVRKVHDFTAGAAPQPFQQAGIAAMELPDSYYEELRQGYTRRRAIMMEGLNAAGFRPIAPEGTYYMMADISLFGFDNDVAFAEYLVREIGVACVPGSSFYQHPEQGRNRVRFSFCKRPETLALACQRMRRLRDQI